MNISENLQRIQEAKADIKNALNTKQNAGITDQKLDSYADFVKTPAVQYNYDQASGGSAVGIWGQMSDLSSSSIVWTSGSATDVFESATNTDVLTITSSSSTTRNTGYIFFNVPAKYFIYQIQLRTGQYSSTYYLPYSLSLECYNYSTRTWDQFANITPSSQGISIRSVTQYSFYTGLTNADINIFSKVYSPTLTDMFNAPNEKRHYRLGLQGDSYNVNLKGHVISLSRIYFRGINLVDNVGSTLTWN